MTPAAPNVQTPKKRSPFFRFLTIALIICFVPIFVLAGTVAATGTVMVEVHDRAEGMHLWIPVPALLLDIALFAAPLVMPEDALDEARAELAPYADGLEAFVEALEDMPSGVLVEVDSPTEHVRVSKDGGKLRIDVDSPDAEVHVSVPVRILGSSLNMVI